MKKIYGILFFILGTLLLSPQPLRADLKTGEPAPDFTLTDIHGAAQALSSFKGKTVVLEWTNYQCPFVVKHYGSGNMQNLQKSYTGQGVIWLSINSSAEGKQGHFTPEKWKAELAGNKAAPTAVLLDPDGKVGKTYGAQTTPHMYIIDPQGNLIYEGAIDDKASTEAGDIASSKNYVQAALDESLAGKPVSVSSTKAYGCSVKY